MEARNEVECARQHLQGDEPDDLGDLLVGVAVGAERVDLVVASESFSGVSSTVVSAVSAVSILTSPDGFRTLRRPRSVANVSRRLSTAHTLAARRLHDALVAHGVDPVGDEDDAGAVGDGMQARHVGSFQLSA